MNYTKARKNSTFFLALTSVSITLFDEILPFFTEAHEDYFRWHDVKGKKVSRRRSHTIQSNSPTVEGKMHDKKMADTMYSFPYECIHQQDTGYQGYNPENVTVIQPTKKPKGTDLTAAQKAANKDISGTRIKVEHAIGGAKTLRIVKDECRLRKGDFVRNIFHLAAGLHNWRFKTRS